MTQVGDIADTTALCNAWPWGTFGSPSVFDNTGPGNGDIALASDDAGIYAFDNVIDTDPPLGEMTESPNHLCFGNGSNGGSFSGSGVLFNPTASVPYRVGLWISETNVLRRIQIPPTQGGAVTGPMTQESSRSFFLSPDCAVPSGGVSAYGTSLSGDSSQRIYLGTPGCGPDSRRVWALKNKVGSSIETAWSNLQFVLPCLDNPLGSNCSEDTDLQQEIGSASIWL